MGFTFFKWCSKNKVHSLSLGTRSTQATSTGTQISLEDSENKIIIQAIQEESPTYSLKTLLGSHFQDTDISTITEPTTQSNSDQTTWTGLHQVFWGARMEIVTLVGSSIVMSLLTMKFLIIKHLIEKYLEGGCVTPSFHFQKVKLLAWVSSFFGHHFVCQSLSPTIITQAWISLLNLIRLGSTISFNLGDSKLKSQQAAHLHHLKCHIVPGFLTYTCVALLAFRSSLMQYLASPAADHLRRDCIQEGTIFTLTAFLFLCEGFSAQPSSFQKGNQISSLASPETNASFFSCMTFSFLDSFIFQTAFRSPNNAPIPIQTIADLKVENKAAHTLLCYRRDSANLHKVSLQNWSLLAKLCWHFRLAILQQHVWASLHVLALPFPAIILVQLLEEISTHKSTETGFVGVVILLGVGIFSFQLLDEAATLYGLFVGRQMGLRIK